MKNYEKSPMNFFWMQMKILFYPLCTAERIVELIFRWFTGILMFSMQTISYNKETSMQFIVTLEKKKILTTKFWQGFR